MAALQAAPAIGNLCSPSPFSSWELEITGRVDNGLQTRVHPVPVSPPSASGAHRAEEERGGFAGGSLGF